MCAAVNTSSSSCSRAWLQAQAMADALQARALERWSTKRGADNIGIVVGCINWC